MLFNGIGYNMRTYTKKSHDGIIFLKIVFRFGGTELARDGKRDAQISECGNRKEFEYMQRGVN